ncbi:class F sortase [Paenibacillus sp. NPDC057886]|uniref:class F sortase n=1 Tax=Paenibacillus sp. NPDC057886 TaxID=3346270 RepID=UPI0036A7B776
MTKRYFILFLFLVYCLNLNASFGSISNNQFQSPREAFQANSYSDSWQEKMEVTSLPALKPVRLCIPSVNLSAPVVPVGTQKDGRLGVPKSSKIAGYYAEGVLPGEPGNALIAGHVDDYKGPGIFYPLKKLKPGAFILLFDEGNRHLIYQVESVESYFTKEAPLDRIFGQTDDFRLNLITCTGKYNRAKQEHEQRLIVYTKLIK